MIKHRKTSEPQQLSFDIDSLLRKSVKMMTTDEIFGSLGSIDIVDLKEDRRVERKVSGVSARALGDYFSIFANTPPDGGIILIGVDDDGSVSGCDSASQNHLNDLERAGDIFLFRCALCMSDCRPIK